MKEKKGEEIYALCVENKDSEDLEKRKIYRVIPDEQASKEGYLRVVDESGGDYLYPESYFVIVQLPKEAEEAITKVTGSGLDIGQLETGAGAIFMSANLRMSEKISKSVSIRETIKPIAVRMSNVKT